MGKDGGARSLGAIRVGYCEAEVGVEFHRQTLHGRAEARAKAEEQQVVHPHDAAVLAGRRQVDAGLVEQPVHAADALEPARRHQDGIRLGAGDGFRRHRLKPLEPGDGVLRAGQLDHGLGRRSTSGDVHRAGSAGVNEEHPRRGIRGLANIAGLRQVAFHLLDERVGLCLPTQEPADPADFLLCARDGGGIWEEVDLHARAPHLVEDAGRTGALQREDERRVQRKNAFGRQATEIPDAGLLGGGRRIDARRIDADHLAASTKRIHGFGNRPAERDDAARICSRLGVGGRGRQRTGKDEDRNGAQQGGQGHEHRGWWARRDAVARCKSGGRQRYAVTVIVPCITV
jgi:hypothetical protein